MRDFWPVAGVLAFVAYLACIPLSMGIMIALDVEPVAAFFLSPLWPFIGLVRFGYLIGVGA